MEAVKKEKVIIASDHDNNVMVTSKRMLEKALEDSEFRDADELLILAYWKDEDYYNFGKSGRLSKEKKLWHLEQWKQAVLRGDA